MVTEKQHIIKALLDEQEKERSAIATELHSNIAQILVSALLYHGLSRSALSTPSTFFEETELLINDAIDATRNLSMTLYTPHFGEESLVQALDNINFGSGTPVTIHKNMNGFNEHDLTHRVKLTLYRIVQAQLGSLANRPGVRNIHLVIRGDHEGIVLRISDDSLVTRENATGFSGALTSILARVTLLNGETSFITTPGKGTELEVTLGKT